MAYLTPHYDPTLVVASVLIASFASYVALDLAKRVRDANRSVALTWWVGGSIAMGTGIWSMHFVGMLASLPSRARSCLPRSSPISACQTWMGARWPR